MDDKKKQELQEVLEATKKMQDERHIAEREFSKNIQQSLYYFLQKNAYMGNLLTELNFYTSYQLPTAALCYDKQKRNFNVIINPVFFNKHTLEQREGILHHEVLHFLYDHIMRFGFDSTDPKENTRKNLATDMAINQYIPDLPEGCVDVKQFKLPDGKLFPVLRGADEYLKLLKDDKTQEANKDTLKKYMGEDGNGETLDQHNWDADLSEDEKKEFMEEMKKVLKRSIEKTAYGHDKVPDFVKDLLESLDKKLQGLNAKGILRQAIKKSVSFADRTSTWKRPNKRYKEYSPGTNLGKVPNLSIYIDTSGSISHRELNEFLSVLESFLKAGTRKCFLGLWHTSLYYKKKYKMRQRFDQAGLQSGGTDVTGVMEDINKTKPDLSLVLTDGYFDQTVEPKAQTIFIISKGGNKDFHWKNKFKTIYLEDLMKI